MEKRVESALAGKPVDGYEIFSLVEESATVEARDGDVDFVKESSSAGWALRVLKGARMGFSYTVSPDPESVEKMVEGALFGATYGEVDEAHGFPSPSMDFPDILLSIDPSPPSPAERVEFSVDMEKVAMGVDRRVKRVRYATLREGHRRVRVKNSLGVEGEYEKSTYLAYVYAVAEEKDQSETGFGLAVSDRFEEMREKLEKVATDAALRALRMLRAKRLKTGKYPVIVENRAMVELLEVLAPSFSAKQVFLGRSMLAGKKGEKICSPEITIVDDPLVKGALGTCLFDDEGVPVARTYVVKEGVLLGYLSDTFYGRKLGMESTGSARRGNIKSPPEIGSSNLVLEAGEAGLEEMKRALGKGVLLTGFLGIHTADPVSGDFSVGAQGFFFEGGGGEYPVRTFAVSGNILELFERVVSVGNDMEMFGSVGSPSVAFEEIDVGGE